MQTFGKLGNFKCWIQILLLAPKCRLCRNSILCEPFSLFRCICQGSPLSPLLLLFAIETLAIYFRQYSRMTGIQFNPTSGKLRSYADDVIMFNNNVHNDLPVVMEVVEWFRSFSAGPAFHFLWQA